MTVAALAAPAATAVLAPQLRALRAARGLTLEALAAAVGLDKGFLSRLERGQKAPSIGTLLRLATALEVPVAELLGETLADDAVRISRAARRGRRGGVPAGSHAFEPLTTLGGALDAFIVHPGPDFAEDGPHEHAGAELLLVLAGVIELAFADRAHVLRAGDAAEFPGHLPHRLRRQGPAPAAALVAVPAFSNGL